MQINKCINAFSGAKDRSLRQLLQGSMQELPQAAMF
jgi:hypothetical protein